MVTLRFTGLTSVAKGFELGVCTWMFDCAMLEEIEDPFPAKNMIAWTCIKFPKLILSSPQF